MGMGIVREESNIHEVRHRIFITQNGTAIVIDQRRLQAVQV